MIESILYTLNKIWRGRNINTCWIFLTNKFWLRVRLGRGSVFELYWKWGNLWWARGNSINGTFCLPPPPCLSMWTAAYTPHQRMAGEIPPLKGSLGWIELRRTVWRHRAAPSAEKYKAALDCPHHKSVEQESSLVCQEIWREKMESESGRKSMRTWKVAFPVRKKLEKWKRVAMRGFEVTLSHWKRWNMVVGSKKSR